MLKQELALAFLETMTEPVPPDSNISFPLMHQRDGVRATLEQVFDWEPQNIREMRKDGKEVVIED